LFTGRCLGCGLFLVIAYGASQNAALKYALPAITLLQMLSIVVSGRIVRGLNQVDNSSSVFRLSRQIPEA
jgi:YQGE family putative transporter